MSIFAFIIGACLGSFANVIMTRLNALSLLSRSKCLSCGALIRKRDNIPIISYLIRRGRCYACQSKYSSHYLWIELAMGVVGVIVWANVYDATMPMYISITKYTLDLIAFTLLICISAYDMKHKIVPPQLSLSLIIVGLVLSITRLWMPHTDGLLYVSMDNAFFELLGGLLTATPYALLFLVSRGRWVGFGDVLVYAGVGWAFGLVSGISIFLSSIWIGSIFVIIWSYMHRGRKLNMSTIEIPFAPFIAIAALIVYAMHIDILGIESIIRYGL